MTETTKQQQGRNNLANLLTDRLNKLAEEDEKKRNAQIKKANRLVENEKKPDETHTRTREYTTTVNGEPTKAIVQEKQIKENGLERNITEITVGKTRKTYYEINRRETENRIAEVAEEEEDRLDKYGDLPF